MDELTARAIPATVEVPGEWDLSDLSGRDGVPAWDDQLDQAREEAVAFRDRFKGQLGTIDSAAFADALRAFETIVGRLLQATSYAQLRYAAAMSDPERGRFLQDVQERYNEAAKETLFFTLELNRLEEDSVTGLLAGDEAQRYTPWVRDSRVFRPHQLSDELEEFIHDLSVTGTSAWSRLFDQTIAEMRLEVNGAEMTLADCLNLLDHTDGDIRRAAAKAIGKGLGDRINTFSLIINTLAKGKEIDDRWRKYQTPVSFRNLANRIEDEVVEALVAAVRDAYAELGHRYYPLKARWFGQETLNYWDRNAPLPGGDTRQYTWREAQDIVLDAFGNFDPRMAAHAARFFDEGWIDAGPRPGKDPGAFCHPTVPHAHPYVLMNFFGRARDVTTLAHELGHGVHQLQASRQGVLMADTPLTLAETASVFGEMLVFRSLLNQETDADQRRRLIASKVESMLNTVVRQVAFHEFERRIHGLRKSGEVSEETIGDTWLAVQSESLGPALRFDDEYRHFWAYIPHFIHAPFYVYAYAFGDCLVNSLYQVYLDGSPGFNEAYMNMLAAGGTLRHRDLLRPFGLDASDPDFWRRGIQVIAGLIDELEATT